MLFVLGPLAVNASGLTFFEERGLNPCQLHPLLFLTFPCKRLLSHHNFWNQYSKFRF